MDLKKLIEYVRNLPTFGKVIWVILVALVAVLVCVSCTTSRNVSVSVDKAEAVSINVRDSTNVSNPMF